MLNLKAIIHAIFKMKPIKAVAYFFSVVCGIVVLSNIPELIKTKASDSQLVEGELIWAALGATSFVLGNKLE